MRVQEGFELCQSVKVDSDNTCDTESFLSALRTLIIVVYGRDVDVGLKNGYPLIII